MLTQYLGYQMTNDEYKVMGLSSYGSPEYLDKFAKLLRPNGINYELDPELDKRRRDAEIFTSDFSTRQERIFTEREEILGPWALARRTARPAYDQHRSERPEAARDRHN